MAGCRNGLKSECRLASTASLSQHVAIAGNVSLEKLTCHTPVYTRSLPCTCIRILRRSSGATAVRDRPPATPPAIRDFAIDDHEGEACGPTGSDCLSAMAERLTVLGLAELEN